MMLLAKMLTFYAVSLTAAGSGEICGTTIPILLPRQTGSPSMLEITVKIPDGVVVDVRSQSGTIVGSITPFGVSGPATYQVPLHGLSPGETRLTLAAAFLHPSRESEADPTICLLGFRVED